MGGDNTMGKFNSFLDKASDAILCDSECQKSKTSDELKQKYLNAQTNLITAPNQLSLAAKNYITYSQGEAGYNDYNDAKLEQVAIQVASTFQQTFDDEITKVLQNIDSYDGLFINYMNVVDLYTNYVKENKELEKELKKTTSDVVTNDRKTYYQDQGIDSLNFFYSYIFLIVYIIFIICFGIFSFIFPSDIKWYIRLIILISFIILPFISTKLLSMAIWVFYKIYEVLPRNVHLNEAK
jgi:hypothetical protein